MASHKGKTAKRKNPAPIILEEPEYKAIVTCCHCFGSFDVAEIAGSYLDRHCPLCEKELAPIYYDSQAKVVKRELNYLSRNLEIAQRKREAIHRKLSTHTAWWWKPYRWFLENKLKKIGFPWAETKKRIGLLEKQIRYLTTSRYHSSEWFLRTRIPLYRKVIEPYTLRCLYDNNGIFKLEAADSVAAGVQAEKRVFEALLKKVCDETSPLYRAQLLPNLYLPHQHRNGSSWSQVDMVVLTRKAAFVIEVKARSCDICAFTPFEEIIGSGEKPWFTSEALTAALSQNSRHAADFCDNCNLFPYEQIYEQLVFVNPHSFKTNSYAFVDNVNVSCLSKNVQIDFVYAIERELEKLVDIVSQEKVETVGDELLARFGDLNQKRYAVHTRAIGDR